MQKTNEQKIEKVKELVKGGLLVRDALKEVSLPSWIWYAENKKRAKAKKKKAIVHEIIPSVSSVDIVTVFRGSPEAVAQVVRSLP